MSGPERLEPEDQGFSQRTQKGEPRESHGNLQPHTVPSPNPQAPEAAVKRQSEERLEQ